MFSLNSGQPRKNGVVVLSLETYFKILKTCIVYEIDIERNAASKRGFQAMFNLNFGLIPLDCYRNIVKTFVIFSRFINVLIYPFYLNHLLRFY